MPGIVGIITKMPRERAESELARMVETLRHEGFYKTGTFVDEILGVYVGWSAIEDSFSDNMPLTNETGEATLVFSGEEYPEPGTRQGLTEHGHALSAHPASHLVHLYEEQPNFPSSLNGMFHGLLIDRRYGKVMLFNDRYGMHRIYYHEADDAFYFAAEAKAILKVLPRLRAPNPRSLGEFVAFGCVLEDRTIFQGIQVLPPASAWDLGLTQNKDVYFRAKEWETQPALEPEFYYKEIRDAFVGNLQRYFNGHRAVGIALTGGLDTRTIMAWRKAVPGALPCYTFGGMLRDCEDVRIARRVAKLCKQPHSVIRIGDDFLARFPEYAERTVYLTEGAVSISHCPDLYLSEWARQIAPVKIVGTYGSEVICRTIVFKPETPVAGLFSPEFLAYVTLARDTYEQCLREHLVTFTAIRQSQWHHCGIFALEQTQLNVRCPFLDNDFVRAAYRAPKSNGTNDIRPRLIREGSVPLSGVRSDRGVGGDQGWLVAAVCRAFLEFTMKAEYAYDYGMPQWVARVDHALSHLRLERLFLGRHKFSHFRTWYRGVLSSYVREMLLDSLALSRSYIERNVLEAIVNSHVNGERNYTGAIHKLLTLELLHRAFFDAR